MPVIVNATDPHPFLPSLGDVTAIEAERARHQDIRPLEVAIVNLMADKQAVERQLARWLGHSVLQVHLTFAATDDYFDAVQGGHEPRHTPADHIRKFYSPFRDIKGQKFDGLIITGVNALRQDITTEPIWPQVREILDWSATNALSSLFLCWGAQAALKHFYAIDRTRRAQKTFGVFQHDLVSDRTALLSGFPDLFPLPVSRWNEIEKRAVLPHPELEIVAESAEAGLSLLVESAAFDDGKQLYPRRVFILGHPEYDTDLLRQEYLRDRAADPAYPQPRHYFPDGDPDAVPRNVWRHTGHVFTNWINALYKATPYDLTQIPRPFGTAG